MTISLNSKRNLLKKTFRSNSVKLQVILVPSLRNTWFLLICFLFNSNILSSTNDKLFAIGALIIIILFFSDILIRSIPKTYTAYWFSSYNVYTLSQVYTYFYFIFFLRKHDFTYECATRKFVETENSWDTSSLWCVVISSGLQPLPPQNT